MSHERDRQMRADAYAETSSLKADARRIRNERILMLARDGDLKATEIAARLGCSKAIVSEVAASAGIVFVKRGRAL